MKYINPHDFYMETNGKIIDVDGYYGGQCWDLFAYFCQKYCGKTFSCISTGYVIDLWTHFNECGLSEYFDKVTGDYQDGDWFIWKGPCMITNYSHIAMFRIDNGNGTNIILTQNPNGNPKYVHQMTCNYQGLVGALRPKTNQPKKPVVSDPVEQNINVNQVFVTCNDTMRCRTNCEINNDNCIGFYKTGYYNVLEEKNTDYHWCKLAEDNWVACLDGYANYIPKYVEPVVEEPIVEQPKKEPVEVPKEEDSPITPPVDETPENGQENEKIEDVTPKENVLLWIIKVIYNFIKKIFTKK